MMLEKLWMALATLDWAYSLSAGVTSMCLPCVMIFTVLAASAAAARTNVAARRRAGCTLAAARAGRGLLLRAARRAAETDCTGKVRSIAEAIVVPLV